MFLTQGFVYTSAEQAEARFKNEDPGFQYTRFGNPTVAMFEERLRLFEGAEDCRATATGMAAVTAAHALLPEDRRPHRLGARAVRLVPLHRRDAVPALRHRSARWSTARDLDAWQKAIRPNTKMFFFETPSNPTLELVDIAAVSKIAQDARHARSSSTTCSRRRCCSARLQLGADIVVYSATKHIDGQGRCLGGAVLGQHRFRHQIPAGLGAPDRALDEPVQRLGDAQGPGDHADPRQGAVRDRCQPRRSSGRPSRA